MSIAELNLLILDRTHELARMWYGDGKYKATKEDLEFANVILDYKNFMIGKIEGGREKWRNLNFIMKWS